MLTAVSLFSCIGVAEYYFRDLGIDVLLASDIDRDRCGVYSWFYPRTEVVVGDMSLADTKNRIVKALKGRRVDLVLATPPCQGMSSVGKNRKDEDLDGDRRNVLVLETFDVIDRLDPNYVLIENVPRMLKVKFFYRGARRSVAEILEARYGGRYNIKIDVLNAADFGVPQIRERVIIRLFKKDRLWPDPVPCGRRITVGEAIGHLPPLEAGRRSEIKNHWARPHPERQVECMRHTPTGCSAFDNPMHKPRKKDGSEVRGFRNCYKRMEWDKPAPTVTMRNEIISSQENVHPGRPLPDGTWSDARVLTPRELLILSSLPPDLDLPAMVSDTALRQYIGEGVPSKFMMNIVAGIANGEG